MSPAAFFGRSPLKMTIQPNIGLDASTREAVVAILNNVLADEAILECKTHLAYEQSGGDVHSVFETHKNRINEMIAEIAERISILAGTPPGRLEIDNGLSRLQKRPDVFPGVMSILADHEAFIRFLREDAQVCSEVHEDQGTFALFVGVMRQHEKMAWTLRGFLGPNPVVED